MKMCAYLRDMYTLLYCKIYYPHRGSHNFPFLKILHASNEGELDSLNSEKKRMFSLCKYKPYSHDFL